MGYGDLNGCEARETGDDLIIEFPENRTVVSVSQDRCELVNRSVICQGGGQVVDVNMANENSAGVVVRGTIQDSGPNPAVIFGLVFLAIAVVSYLYGVYHALRRGEEKRLLALTSTWSVTALIIGVLLIWLQLVFDLSETMYFSTTLGLPLLLLGFFVVSFLRDEPAWGRVATGAFALGPWFVFVGSLLAF